MDLTGWKIAYAAVPKRIVVAIKSTIVKAEKEFATANLRSHGRKIQMTRESCK